MEQSERPDPGADAKHKNQPLFLGLATDEDFPHEGRLDFAGITLDPGTGTLQLRGTFENPDRKLLPGLFAKIRAPIGKNENAMLVPQQAVGFDQQGEYVMVVGEDNTVERRGVEQGTLSEGMRVIAKGLKGDEQVIVKGLLRAIPGRKVTPETEHASASKAAQPSESAPSPPQAVEPDATKGSEAPPKSQ